MSNLSPMGDNKNDNDNDNDNDNPYEDDNKDISQENPQDYYEELEPTGDPVEKVKNKTFEKSNEGGEKFNEQSAADEDLDEEPVADNCLNLKSSMDFWYLAAFFPFLILFTFLFVLFSYSSARWIFWTRTFWKFGGTGIIWRIIRSFLFFIVVPVIYFGLSIAFCLILMRLIKILPITTKTPNPIVSIILITFTILFGLSMFCMFSIPTMGIINTIYRAIRLGGGMGFLTPVTIDEFVNSIFSDIKNKEDKVKDTNNDLFWRKFDVELANDDIDEITKNEEPMGLGGLFGEDVPPGESEDMKEALKNKLKAKRNEVKAERNFQKAQEMLAAAAGPKLKIKIVKKLNKGTYFLLKDSYEALNFSTILLKKIVGHKKNTRIENSFWSDVNERLQKSKGKGLYSFFVNDTSIAKEGDEMFDTAYRDELLTTLNSITKFLEENKIKLKEPGVISCCCCLIGLTGLFSWKIACCGFKKGNFDPGPVPNVFGPMFYKDTKGNVAITKNNEEATYICSPCSWWNSFTEGFFVGEVPIIGWKKTSLWIIISFICFIISFILWWEWFFGCWGMFEAQEDAKEDGDQSNTQTAARQSTFIKCMRSAEICRDIQDEQDDELINYDYSKYPEKYKEFQDKALKHVNNLTDEEIETFIKTINIKKDEPPLKPKEAKTIIYKQKRRELFNEWRTSEDPFKFDFFKKKCTGKIKKTDGMFSLDNFKKFFTPSSSK